MDDMVQPDTAIGPWVARIGVDAALVQRRSTRILIGTFVGFGLFLVVTLVLSRFLHGEVRNYFALGIFVLGVPAALCGWVWHWRVQGRACRLGAEFVHLQQHTGESALPRAALKNLTMFDNLVWSRGISAEGRYKPQPSSSWTGNNTGRFGKGRFH